MKYSMINLIICLATNIVFGQISGNINYQNRVVYPDNNINIAYPSNSDIFLSVKGLANLKADAYVAIFNITQVGKTTKEVNDLMTERIEQALGVIKAKPGVDVFVDMISFVPVYEFDIEKKIFSRRTYNEVPKGFELKKNIHIKYTEPSLMHDIMMALSGAEIYDLVRVDYISNHMEAIKKQLMAKAKTRLEEQLKQYESLLAIRFDSLEKQLMDGFKVVLPTEMYRSYQAYSNSSLSLKRLGNIKRRKKSTTLYYQPILDKEFDFVINPIIIEPVIQVMYELKLRVKREKKQVQKQGKDYVLITPNGDLKNLHMAH